MPLIFDHEKFDRDCLRVYRDKLARAMSASVGGIRNDTGEAIRNAIEASPECISLLSGQLWHQLGIAEPQVAIEEIIETIVNSIVIEVSQPRVIGKNISGGITIKILRADFRDVLNLPSSNFVSEGGFPIDWLQWLLLEGDSLINVEYRFESGHQQRSRTGDGVMVRNGTWQVPPEYAGSLYDNWLTRALSDLGGLVGKIMINNIKKGF